MKKKDTMLEDFKEFILILKTDSLKNKNVFKRFIKLIRNFFLILVSFWVIPLTHLVIFVFPFLDNSSTVTVEERLENFNKFSQ